MKRFQRGADGFGLAIPIIVIAVLVVMAAVAWVVYKQQNGSKPSAPRKNDTLMIVRYAGGLCPDNKTCSTDYIVSEDGSFAGHTNLSSREVVQLKEVIDKNNFLHYTENPNPACASFHDGQDEILLFPQKYPDKSFTLCMLQIPSNDPAINFIHELIRSHNKQ